jgi:hypothetical protein
MFTERMLRFTVEPARVYFLVSSGTVLPASVLHIRSLLGEKRAIDAVGLQSFSILSVVGFAFLAGLMLITRGLATESLGYLTP